MSQFISVIMHLKDGLVLAFDDAVRNAASKSVGQMRLLKPGARKEGKVGEPNSETEAALLLAEAERHEQAAQAARAKAEELLKVSESAPHGEVQGAAPPSPVDEEMRAMLRSLEGRDGRAPVKYVLTCTLKDYEQMKRDGCIPPDFELVDKKAEAPDDRLKLIEKKYTVDPKYHFTMQTSLSDLRAAVESGTIPRAPERPVGMVRMPLKERSASAPVGELTPAAAPRQAPPRQAPLRQAPLSQARLKTFSLSVNMRLARSHTPRSHTPRSHTPRSHTPHSHTPPTRTHTTLAHTALAHIPLVHTRSVLHSA